MICIYCMFPRLIIIEIKVSATAEDIINIKLDTGNGYNDNEKYPNVCGIWLEDDYIRSYPYESLACDVIGFTVDGNIGNTGIESYYNSVLNGLDGREYGYLDTDSTMARTVKEPVNGNVVVSTIDLQVQSIVEKNIREFMDAGVVGAGVGGNLVNKKWIASGEFEKITEVARQLMENAQ